MKRALVILALLGLAISPLMASQTETAPIKHHLAAKHHRVVKHRKVFKKHVRRARRLHHKRKIV